jgi:CO/xanthine dehydrogenase FAD-binding subunit
MRRPSETLELNQQVINPQGASPMKAAPFDYFRATDLDHALDLLDQHGFDCKLIAGGQSLVPMMAMRLARPAILIDINRLDVLKSLRVAPESVQMGAATRQRDVEDNALLHESLPLVREALKWVGHTQTRNRGTVGGSLVHADPSAELPLAAAVLCATARVRSKSQGERRVAAADLFVGPMASAVNENECLTDIEWPVWSGPGVVAVFDEIAMRHGDFAMASAACQLQIDEAGICRRAAFGLGGVDGTPRAFPKLAAQLIGKRVDAELARELAHAATRLVEPGSDMHADAEYRRHLGAVLLSRVLLRAGSGKRLSH